jgi:hypothetical protein
VDTDTRHIAVVECLASVHNYLLADRFVRDVEVPFLSQSPIPVSPVPSGIQLNAVTVDTMSLSWWRTKSVRGSKLCARAGGVSVGAAYLIIPGNGVASRRVIRMLSALAPMGLVVNLSNTLGLLTLAALLLLGSVFYIGLHGIA